MFITDSIFSNLRGLEVADLNEDDMPMILL
jgi:hypothetical protein